MTPASATNLTFDQVVDFTRDFLAEQGFGTLDVRAESMLADLGLDSITTIMMLTTAKSHFVEAGYALPNHDTSDMPPIHTVGDIATVLGAT